MRAVGIVAEYNPFHTGHAYHIETARKETGADAVVVIMSGSFVQRGEPAIFDKWTRTRMALYGGADLVLELPALYATASAEYFARGAVETLRATGVIGTLSFGSECGDLEKLQRAANLLSAEDAAMRETLQAALASGKSYPAAKMEALGVQNAALGEILASPNNTLAVSYLRFLDNMEAHTVKRKGAGYLETNVSEGVASALEIRSRMLRGESVSAYGPHFPKGEPIHTYHQYEELILYALRSLSWQTYPSIPEAIRRRLLSADTKSLQSVLETTKTKHIVMAAVKRALCQILLQNNLPPSLPPAYIRVLGFTECGSRVLKEMKKQAQLPIISRAASFREVCPIWELEKRATDIFFLPRRLPMQDIKNAPVQIERNEEEQR